MISIMCTYILCGLSPTCTSLTLALPAFSFKSEDVSLILISILFKAILTSEPSHTGHTCCKSTVKTLLKVAKDGMSTDQTPPTSSTEDGVGSSVQSQPAAVHALNILRALYRDSKLGDFIVPFIPEGVMIAIEGFSASLWPVCHIQTDTCVYVFYV